MTVNLDIECNFIILHFFLNPLYDSSCILMKLLIQTSDRLKTSMNISNLLESVV